MTISLEEIFAAAAVKYIDYRGGFSVQVLVSAYAFNMRETFQFERGEEGYKKEGRNKRLSRKYCRLDAEHPHLP